MKKPINYQEQLEDNYKTLNEPMAVYYTPNTFLKNDVLDNLTQNSKDLFQRLVTQTGLTIKILAENIFEITPKTFIKYKNNETKMPSRIVELAIELSTLYELGADIFGNSDEFNRWLDKKNVFFNNNKPSNYLNTSTGIHLVFEEVKRIEFGATA